MRSRQPSAWPAWISNCCAIHHSGDNLRLSKRLDTQRLGCGQSANWRFWVEPSWRQADLESRRHHLNCRPALESAPDSHRLHWESETATHLCRLPYTITPIGEGTATRWATAGRATRLFPEVF